MVCFMYTLKYQKKYHKREKLRFGGGGGKIECWNAETNTAYVSTDLDAG